MNSLKPSDEIILQLKERKKLMTRDEKPDDRKSNTHR
jgi:hypothetical protein